MFSLTFSPIVIPNIGIFAAAVIQFVYVFISPQYETTTAILSFALPVAFSTFVTIFIEPKVNLLSFFNLCYGCFIKIIFVSIMHHMNFFLLLFFCLFSIISHIGSFYFILFPPCYFYLSNFYFYSLSFPSSNRFSAEHSTSTP